MLAIWLATCSELPREHVSHSGDARGQRVVLIARAHAWGLQVLVSDSLVLHVLSLRSVRTLLGWRQRGRSRLLLEPTDTRRDPCHVWRVTSDALAGGQHALLICVYTCSSLAVAQAGHFGQIRSALLVLPLRGGALRRDLR